MERGERSSPDTRGCHNILDYLCKVCFGAGFSMKLLASLKKPVVRLGSFLDPYELVFRFRHFLLWNMELIENVLLFFWQEECTEHRIWFEITG